MRAMILAAGRGERMRPLTDTCPKPLLRAGGLPLIGWHLRRLAAAAYRDVVINHAWHGRAHRAGARRRPRLGRVDRATPPKPRRSRPRAASRYALPLLGDAPFLVVNGDLGTDFPFARLRGALATGVRAHLVLVRNPAHHPNGDFGLAGVRVTRDEHGRHT
jgi:N-acetyl-alpha-D-muramate 1-phosphate uridylyltransferase